jgi:hypothetical protein
MAFLSDHAAFDVEIGYVHRMHDSNTFISSAGERDLLMEVKSGDGRGTLFKTPQVAKIYNNV